MTGSKVIFSCRMYWLALGRWNRGQLVVRRREHDAAAGKREERLQEQLFARQRQRLDVVQEPRPGDCRVPQPRNRELADAEVPLRMARPLDVELIAVVEGKRDAPCARARPGSHGCRHGGSESCGRRGDREVAAPP